MIIVKLQGGLGNQMFQYAVGRHLSYLNNDDELKLDITNYETDSLRRYNLHHLNIRESFATKEEIAWFGKFKQRSGRLWYPYNHLIANENIYVKQRHYHFDPRILALKSPLYLEGDWVTEKYFIGIADIVKNEFSVKEKMGAEDNNVLRRISATNSVAVSVRRGDYVTDTRTLEYHGVCDMEYYKKATEVMASKVKDPHLFVFSDDHEWTKKNMKFNLPTAYVDHNPVDKHYADLRLLSLCKHQIIANSTFSWWGAWLNANKGKVIVAPQKWFNKTKVNVDTKDVIPDTWIKI